MTYARNHLGVRRSKGVVRVQHLRAFRTKFADTSLRTPYGSLAKLLPAANRGNSTTVAFISGGAHGMTCKIQGHGGFL